MQRIAGAPAGGAASTGTAPILLAGNEFLLIIGGMGPKAARTKAMEALGLSPIRDGSNRPMDGKPDAVFVIGLCGALSASLPETRIVAYTDCLSTEPNKPPLRCSRSMTDQLLDLLKSHGATCDPVTGITSPRVAVTKEDRVALARSGASVVDMESYEILGVATAAGIPGAVLRVVSDSLETEMLDFNRALKPDGTVDQWQLFRLVLGSPLRMVRLLAASKRAMKEFAKALEIVLPSDCFAPAISTNEK